MNTKKFAEINKIIQQDLATSRQLLALLEIETDATKTRDFSALTQCLEEKAPLLEQLQQNAQTRINWLNAINLSTDETSWLTFLKKAQGEAPEPIQLDEKWLEVKKTIEHCQKINTINGKLISRGVTSHSRLLQIMRGNTLQADLYNAKGSTQSTALSANLIQA